MSPIRSTYNDPPVAKSAPVADEIKYYHLLHVRLPLRHQGHLRDGGIRYIEGNRDHPVNQGVLCAKGSAGIMQHYSPARLTQAAAAHRPARQRRVSRDRVGRGARHRGRSGSATSARPIRSKLAFFTGRDQSQALTGWWASQFGTPNYAAHGGFCSVNMAAAGLYTIGGSFWEFGEPDWEHAQIFPAVRRRRGPRFQSDQDRPRQAQGARRQDRLDQSGAHRLFGDRRRMDRHPSRHRRPVRAGAGPRTAARRKDRCRRISRATPTRRGSSSTIPAPPTTGCSRATRMARPLVRDRNGGRQRAGDRSGRRRRHSTGECRLADGRRAVPAFRAFGRALSRSALCAGHAAAADRHSRRNDPPHRRRDRRCRLRQAGRDRTALDRLAGPPARDA